jgi:hypothetical protein
MNREIRSAADTCLMEFCKELKENPKKRTVEMDSELIQILLVKLNTEKSNQVTKITALYWLRQYLIMFEEELNQGNTNTNFNISILPKASNILQSILICKASENTSELR